MRLKYLKNVAALELDGDSCTGCGVCLDVCPHGVFLRTGRTVYIGDRDACMECGACARNCPVAAVTVKTGVGCAAAVISSRLKGRTGITCGEGSGCCGDDTAAPEKRGKSGSSGCGCSGST